MRTPSHTRRQAKRPVARAPSALLLVAALLSAGTADAQYVVNQTRINARSPGFEELLEPEDNFGVASTSLGDLDGNGTLDLAVGAWRDNDGAPRTGAVWILFLEVDGSVAKVQKISNTQGGFGGQLPENAAFGSSLANLGDLDGDGTVELAVGARNELGPRGGEGAVWILSLRPNGTVEREVRLGMGDGGFGGTLGLTGQFGTSLSVVPDLDGNGTDELAVGAVGDQDGGVRAGALWILFLRQDGLVLREQKISSRHGALSPGPTRGEGFGEAVASIGDLDGDGLPELAVGAKSGQGTGNGVRGTVTILFLRQDGSVKRSTRISDGEGGFSGKRTEGDGFGGALAPLGDLDGDGIPDLAVSATTADDQGSDTGAVWVLFLGRDGSTHRSVRIASGQAGFTGELVEGARFGFSVSALGDLDGDGRMEIVAGVRKAEAEWARGGFWVLSLNPDGTVFRSYAVNSGTRPFAPALAAGDGIGRMISRLGDLDGNGVDDLAIAVASASSRGPDRRGVWVLFMDRDGRTMRRQEIPESLLPVNHEAHGRIAEAMTGPGDVDGDGVPDIALTSTPQGTLGPMILWILFLHRDGSPHTIHEVDLTAVSHESGINLGLDLPSLGSIGDLDGDGRNELALGRPGAGPSGEVWVLFLDSEGAVRKVSRIDPKSFDSGLADRGIIALFGSSVAGAGDLNSDGVPDLVVAGQTAGETPKQGAWALLLRSDGSVAAADQAFRSDGPASGSRLRQGRLILAEAGDFNRDGVPDLAVGEPSYDAASLDQGGLVLVALGRNGAEVNRHRVNLELYPGEAAASEGRRMGSSLAFLGSSSGRGRIVVGAPGDDTGGRDTGALYVLDLGPWHIAYRDDILRGLAALLVMIAASVFFARVYGDRLRKRNLALERAVASRTAELRKANELKSRFLTNISHEFRTPLTLTFGPIEDLINGHYDSIDESRPDLRRARRNGHRLLRLINQLLDLSRLESGALQLELGRHDIASLLRQISALFSSVATSRGIGLSVQVPSSPFWHTYDQDKVEKVLINLLSNAFKFTPDGGNVSVTLRAGSERSAIIEVSDNGCGIPEEHLGHIFDRFFQVDATPTRSSEGSGVGLALVRELVELHRGAISVTSTQGEGSRFEVTIPFIPNVTPNTSGQPPTPEDAPRTTWLDPIHSTPKPEPCQSESGDTEDCVLIVEDNADMRAYVRGHLKEWYEVAEAKNGLEGLERARDLVPDLIVLDVMMPKLNGMEVLQALRTDDRTSHIPVVLLTAKTDLESRVEGFQTGADAMLPKPFNARELRARVAGLIAQRRQLWRVFSSGKSATIPATPVTFPPREDQFLRRVGEAVESRMERSTFGVDELAETVGMSRRQLLRKLRALTGETPVELIRRLRLERARQMLEQGAGSVKEVAYGVGFQSTSYFTRSFQSSYGVTPSEVAKRRRK